METSTTSAGPETVTPDDLLRQKLRHASTEDLIQVLIQLTHKIHGRKDPVADRLREQREYVIAELKRRTDSAADGASGGAA